MNPLAASDSAIEIRSSDGDARPGRSSPRIARLGIFALRRLAGIPAAILLGLIRLYQRTLSPALPVLTLGQCGCRFSPTCSHYAAEAIRTHGALRGFALAVIRLLKCTPLHPGGFDPVPSRRCCSAGRAGSRGPLGTPQSFAPTERTPSSRALPWPPPASLPLAPPHL